MSYKLKLGHLRAFQAIMLTGSITAAADRLHMTQPSLSKQLASLEEILGFRLFDRSSGGRLVPTSLGLQFYRQVEGTLSGIEHLPEIAQDLLKSGEARLRIGATPPLMNSVMLSSALSDFLIKFPDRRLTIESRPRQDIEEWVANGQIDLGLALLPIENPFIKSIPLVNTSAVAIIRRDHPLAKQKVLNPRVIQSERLILPHGQLLRALIDQAAVSAGHTLSADIEASSALTCCKLAASGLGIGICDPFSPSAFRDEDVCLIPWEPKVPLVYGILLRKDREPGSGLDALIACIEQQASKLR